ncbi:hypothetical protein [Streptomyces tropicalis]|uniref:Uncharacterized protein n=1 Tax=Streptomyces tropicalis TaxID=3034234 RepID=A0ABT6AER1_9ACTN|nr:hypothetical protein [Streptomyces tropicalis]MDF3303136.1 hypothetical protein [Streptomyces tropicalis]
MITVLVPLLQASCPPQGGGYGGSVELRMPDQEAEELGGAGLLRSALRAAARQLAWKVETYAWVGTQHGTMVGVVDRRDVPSRFAKAVRDDMALRARAAVNRVGRPGAPAQHASAPAEADPHMPTAAFRTAYEQAQRSAASSGDSSRSHSNAPGRGDGVRQDGGV